MKRISRALALILSICVVFAMVAVFAFAAESVSQLDASQYGKGIKNISYNTEGIKQTSNGGDAYGAYTKETISSADGNKYGKLTRSKTNLTFDEMTAAKYISKFEGEYSFVNGFTGNSVTKTYLADYDYLVWSLDFTSEAVDKNGKPVYLDESFFATYGNTYYYNYIVKDVDGDWFMSGDAEYSENDAPLAAEPGAWNNLTVVASKATGSVYSFVNGKHFNTNTGASSYAVDRIIYNIWYSSDIYNADWSVSVDNISFNAYGPSYTSSVAYGLDNYFADLDLSTNINVCGDIVYNSSYKLPSGANAIEYTVVSDGISKNYTDQSKVVDAIPTLSAGDSITADIKIDILLNEAGVSFVRAKSGYKYIYTVTGKASSANPEIVKGNLASITSAGSASSRFSLYYEGMKEGFVLADAMKKGFIGSRTSKSYQDTVNNSHYNYFLGEIGTSDSKHYPQSTKYKYVTMDFDIAASGYVYLPDGNTDGVYRYTGSLARLSETELATAKLSYWEGGIINILSNSWDFSWYYVSNDGKWYLSLDKTYSEDDTPLAEGVGEWNHITFISDLNTMKLYVYMNGKYITTGAFGSKEFERISFLRLNGTKFSEHDMRVGNVDINYYTNNYSSGENVFGLDDYIASGGPEKYDISFVEDCTIGINGKNYGVPSNVKLVRGEETLYYTGVSKAIKGAKTGDTLYYDGTLNLISSISMEIETLNVKATDVTLASDAALFHDYIDGVITRKGTYTATWVDENGINVKVELVVAGFLPNVGAIKYNGKIKGEYNAECAWKWAFADSKEYRGFSTIAEYDIKVDDSIVIIPNTVDVAWFDTEGYCLDYEKWFVGAKASRDFSGLEEIELLENGWYEYSYFWNSQNEDMTLVEGKNRAFVPVIEPVEAFTGLKYNFSLGSYFYINHYVPVPDEFNIEVTGAKFSDSCVSTGLSSAKPYFNDISESTSRIFDLEVDESSIVKIDGRNYYKFDNECAISAYSFYALQGFEVYYTVEIDGQKYEFSSKVALTRLGTKENDAAYHSSYIYSVLNNYECGSEEKSLIVNMARYMSQSYAMQGGYKTFTEVNNILASHKDCCCIKSLESYLPAEAPSTDASGLAIADGFGASYLSDQTISTLVLYIPKSIADANSDLTVKADIEKAIINGENELKTLAVNFTRMTSKDAPVVKKNGGVDCYVYIPVYKENAAYNADLVYNITISYGGNEYKGTYSLSTYVYNLNKTHALYVYDGETGEYKQSESVTTLTAEQRAINLLLAQRAYAIAAREYKLN